MRKKSIQLLLFALSLLLIFSGCKSGTGDTQDTEPPAVPVDPITLFSSAGSAYTIVRGERASTEIINAAIHLRESIQEASGVDIPLNDDYMYGVNGGTVAIVVGVTTDERSQELRDSMQYNDYMIRVENNNLYLIGGSDEATVDAVDYFIERYLSQPVESLQLEGNLDMKYIHEYALPGMSIAGNPIASYKIVYDNALYYARQRAEDLCDLIVAKTGVVLEVVADTSAEESANEILVGITNRAESRQAEAAFAAPNLYYSVTVSGTKLVLANQGVRSGEAAVEALGSFLDGLTQDACNLTSENLNMTGDIIDTLDVHGANIRPNGTDLRVMHSNVLISTRSDNDNGYSDQQRAELLVDTYLVYMPDVITFNEMIPGRNINAIIRSLLSEYYTFTEAEYLNLFPDPSSDQMDDNLKNRRYSTPIAYSKTAGLTEIDSGFSYLSDMISYHGVAWTVFENEDGNRFLVASAHFSENRDIDDNWITTFAEDTITIINQAREEYGDLPVIANGDWFFWQNTAPYRYIIESGFLDASEEAVNRYSDGIGTYHTIGVGSTDRVEEDMSFFNPTWLQALAHKNLVDFYTVNGSDHYPVLADYALIKSSTADDIPPFDDGTGDLDIVEEGPGGSGEWGTDVVPES